MREGSFWELALPYGRASDTPNRSTIAALNANVINLSRPAFDYLACN